MIDIYFDKNYGKLYEHIENGKAKVFKYKDSNGIISNQFIVKEIPIKIDDNKYYDIITPYGYGGPIIESCTEGGKKDLVNNYENAFKKYCQENNIVSEFVRFHPIIDNIKDFEKLYDAKFLRHTVGTNLKISDNPMEVEFSKSCRKNIRKALNKGIAYKVTVAPEDLCEFKKIYYITMKRNNASNYYYFGDEYFKNILKYFKENVVLVDAIFENKVIASGLYFIYNNLIHIHLTGTLNEYMYISPEYVLRYAITIWGKENGYEIVHNGGGRSNSEEDSLYKFKKQFAQNTEFDFYIGKKIWNEEVYNRLCEYKKIDKSVDFFPAYRKD